MSATRIDNSIRLTAIGNTACPYGSALRSDEQAVPPGFAKSKIVNRQSPIGFTLVELMVVVVIIGILVTIMVPTINRVRLNIKTSATQTTINALDQACQMYYKDLGEYPPSEHAGSLYGGQRLVEALTGYQIGGTFNSIGDALTGGGGDGQDGPGFRMFKGGQIYGPYNGAENMATVRLAAGAHPYFADSFGDRDAALRRILYYRFDQDAGRFNNDADTSVIHPTDADAYAKNGGGTYYRRDFILINAGPDGVFTPPRDGRSSDDVTNFFNQ
jgi:prepilin-type N-terminal cleavage/methylation domain-containing protein